MSPTKLWVSRAVFFTVFLAALSAQCQSVAILKDDIPASAGAASPEYLGQVLEQSGFSVVFLSCDELADAKRLNPEQIDVAVLPYGASFPLRAAENFRRFLREGGKFFSTGGYAFDSVLERTADGWEPLPAPEPLLQHVVWRRTFAADELRALGRLTFSCYMKAEKVAGEGMAYLAVYQYGRDGAVLQFIDFAKVTGPQDWREFQHRFSVTPAATRLELHAGLYHCRGTAWFDDAQLVTESGRTLLSDNFEAPFDPDGNPSTFWARSDTKACRVQTNVCHSGSHALETKLEGRGPEDGWLNTRHGRPGDGLETRPDQLGVFDADYPLERVVVSQAAPDQSILPRTLSLKGELKGWAAVGATSFDAARWLPLLNGYDRYGRLRGAVGAMLRHSSGAYAGSSWAYFGVTNRDVFAQVEPAMAGALVGIVRSLARDTYITWLVPDRGCYRQGERVGLLANVFNGGRRARELRLRAEIYEGEPPESGELNPGLLRKELDTPVTVSPGKARQVTLEWMPDRFSADFYYVRARLCEGDEEVDQFASGFIVWNTNVVAAGPQVNLRNNYLRLGKRPMFLFGTDDWSYVFNTKRETPLQWLRDMRQRRDLGVQIYENLQFGMIPPFTAGRGGDGEALLRKVDGIIQLAQKYQQVYFAGLLIGYNTASSATELKTQTDFCREFARRYASVPGLIHYLNGDLRCQLGPAVTPEWNQFLQERYGSPERLREAWGKTGAGLELGKLEAEDYQDWSQTWGDVQAYDLNQFRAWLIRRWHHSLVSGIREVDARHLTSSEFYQLPHQGVDVPAGIDGLDLCNFGYFDKPGADLARFPAICKYNDQRARGKSVGPGEYGVKTHPAWGDGKDYGYHITRRREEAAELFLGIAHYSFGLGASRIHNWCWKDDANRVFPWGMVNPCDGVPKPTAYIHRNQSLLFRHFAPVYREPNVYVLTADSHRFGGGKWQVIEGILRSFEIALGAHVDNLGTLNEQGLQIPKSAKAIFYPLPFCPADETCARLVTWVREGGTLYVSGDVSYDQFRQRTRTNRLEELCGVRFVAECYANIVLNSTNAADQPCIRVSPVGAKVVKQTADGLPLVLENRIGKGKVLFTTDPIEMHAVPSRRASDLELYRRTLHMAGVKPLDVAPDDPLLHVFRVPLEDGGTVYIVFNTDQKKPSRQVVLKHKGPVPVALSVDRKRPALLWFDHRDALRAVEVQGECLMADRQILADGTRGSVMTLDGLDVRRSQALLLMPLRAGTVRVNRQSRLSDAVVGVGEVQNGLWRSFETLPLETQWRDVIIEVTPEQAASLLLVCSKRGLSEWRKYIERAITDPASLRW